MMQRRLKLVISTIIAISLLIVIVFFKAKYDMGQKVLMRKEVVELIRGKKVTPDNRGRIVLPLYLQDCSYAGKVYVTINKDSLSILFPVSLGMKSNFEGYLYYDGPDFSSYEPPSTDHVNEVKFIDIHSIDQVLPMDGTEYRVHIKKAIEKNWYSVYRDID